MHSAHLRKKQIYFLTKVMIELSLKIKIVIQDNILFNLKWLTE